MAAGAGRHSPGAGEQTSQLHRLDFTGSISPDGFTGPIHPGRMRRTADLAA
jgi:hypothetical protein